MDVQCKVIICKRLIINGLEDVLFNANTFCIYRPFCSCSNIVAFYWLKRESPWIGINLSWKLEVGRRWLQIKMRKSKNRQLRVKWDGITNQPIQIDRHHFDIHNFIGGYRIARIGTAQKWTTNNLLSRIIANSFKYHLFTCRPRDFTHSHTHTHNRYAVRLEQQCSSHLCPRNPRLQDVQ